MATKHKQVAALLLMHLTGDCKNRPMKEVVEWRVDKMTSRHVTAVCLVCMYTDNSCAYQVYAVCILWKGMDREGNKHD